MCKVFIRKMTPEDLQKVHSIEVRCFTTPWSMSSFRHEQNCRQTILKVAVFNEHIIGYICVRTILDLTHILNIAVLPEFRRIGIGSLLLRKALHELRFSQPGERFITLEVRESNSAAIKLYERSGFKIKGRRTGYYNKPPEDAIIMLFDMRKNPYKKKRTTTGKQLKKTENIHFVSEKR